MTDDSGNKINFDRVILDLRHDFIMNKKMTKIVELLDKRNWTELRSLIRTNSFLGEKIWSDGYALLDKVIECKDHSLLWLLIRLFSSLDSVVKTNNEFPLLKFVFYFSIKLKNRLLIDKIISVGVSVNDLLNGVTPLLTAISSKAGLDIIRLIIDHGASVNGKDKREFEAPLPCVIASVPFDLEVAELLFSHGADVSTIYTNPRTTLVHLACDRGNKEGLMWLLNHKADPNIQDDIGETGLHIAVTKGDLSSVKALLEHGALPNVFNKRKLAPLLIAVQTNDFEITKLLLPYGTEYCCTTLSQALRMNIVNVGGPRESYDQHRILKILSKHGFVLRVNIHDQELVHAAARNGHFRIVKRFLELKGSPNSVFANTPLIYDAIKSKNKYIVQILLDYGSHTIYEDCIGVSALTISVSSNLVEITELLLSKGRDDLSEACVGLAAKNLNIDMLNVLIKFGVNVDIRDAFTNFSPIHFAILSQNHVSRSIEDIDKEKTEVVKLLLNNGVSLSYAQPNEHPIHFAIAMNYIQVVKVLLEAGTSLNYFEQVGTKQLPSTILHFAIKYNSNEMVKVLLENGASVDALQFDGRTPLELAMGLHSWSVVKVLLENGANVGNTSDCSKNLLFHAVEENFPTDVVSDLLKFGADVDRRGYGCKTALHKACFSGNGFLVAVLLDHGADVNAIDCEGNTPFMEAKKTLLAVRIVAQENWFGYEQGSSIAGPSTPLYHLQRHAFKMNFVGLPLHPCFKPVLELKYTEDFVGSCKKELEVMKVSKISGSWLCFYDVIKQIQDPAYVYNKSVLLNLDDDDDKWEHFILYRGILRACIKKAIVRSKLIDSGQKCLSGVLNLSCLHYLPNEVIRKIISYLNNEELQILQ